MSLPCRNRFAGPWAYAGAISWLGRCAAGKDARGVPCGSTEAELIDESLLVRSSFSPLGRVEPAGEPPRHRAADRIRRHRFPRGCRALHAIVREIRATLAETRVVIAGLETAFDQTRDTLSR